MTDRKFDIADFGIPVVDGKYDLSSLVDGNKEDREKLLEQKQAIDDLGGVAPGDIQLLQTFMKAYTTTVGNTGRSVGEYLGTTEVQGRLIHAYLHLMLAKEGMDEESVVTLLCGMAIGIEFNRLRHS